MRKNVYYSLENMDQHVYCVVDTKREAKKIAKTLSNEGICYKCIDHPTSTNTGEGLACRKEKFCFMW